MSAKIMPWKYRARDYPTNLTIPQMFESRVEASPDAVAVVFKGAGIAYTELNSKANQLARYLVNHGIGPETTVAVSMDRSYEVYVALMAVQKAGGAYVPIEPMNPESRLEFLVRDSAATIVVTQRAFADKFGACTVPVFCIDDEWDAVQSESDTNLEMQVEPSNLSDVIYTSGSTGLPKGVMSTHRNRVNALFAWEEVYGLSPQDVLFQTTSLGFDVFTGDYTRSLCLGAKIVPSEENFTLSQYASVERMYELLVSEGVTFAEFNVTTIRRLFSYVKTNNKPLDFLRIIVVGADAWYMSEDKELFEYNNRRTTIFNSYGMTEEAVDSLYFVRSMITDPDAPRLNNRSLIGVPFPNTKVYLLRDNLEPVDDGEVGVMYFGGPNTARGYLRRDELTKQRFIPNPFEPETGEMLYNSGDLGRVNEDGVLEFLGRVDFQVEISSKRVEINEVEAAILAHPSVRETLVTGVTRADKETVLVAYVVFEPKEGIATEVLGNWLKSDLPGYMIPSIFIVLERLPINASGKVDRNMLPIPRL